jgi:uncharacterized protein YhbP (UPF0306 family)
VIALSSGQEDQNIVLSHAKDLLQAEHTLAVATIGPDGSPWVANLYFAVIPPPADKNVLQLCVLTSPESQHARHWDANGEVALAVFGHPDFPRQSVKGLQMKGRCVSVNEAQDESDAVRCYRARFPDASQVEAGQTYYVIEVSWLKWLDRSTGQTGTWPS